MKKTLLILTLTVIAVVAIFFLAGTMTANIVTAIGSVKQQPAEQTAFEEQSLPVPSGNEAPPSAGIGSFGGNASSDISQPSSEEQNFTLPPPDISQPRFDMGFTRVK